MVLNSKEKHVPNQYPCRSITCDDDKENEFKFLKLDTDMKSYETLVKELNKLSADEENIRNKLFDWKVCFYIYYIFVYINLNVFIWCVKILRMFL